MARRTLIIRDGSVDCSGFRDQYQALGCLSMWLDKRRVEDILTRMRETYLAEFVPCAGNLLLKGNGDVRGVGFASVYQAIGFALHFINQKAESPVLDVLTGMLPGHEPIKGHLVFHGGGELDPVDFFDPYECIGFAAVALAPNKIQEYQDTLTRTPADKFVHPVKNMPGIRLLKLLEKVVWK